MNDRTISRLINIAVILAAISGVMTVIVAFTGYRGRDLGSLGDAVLIFGLAFGLFKRSRTCAIILLIHFLAGRVDMIARTGNLFASLNFFAIANIVMYILAIVATFAYHGTRRTSQKGTIQGACEVTTYPATGHQESTAKKVAKSAAEGAGCLGALVYFGIGLVQLAAFMCGIIDWWGIPWWIAIFIATPLSYVPILGTVLGIMGAIKAWDWTPIAAIAIFCWPFILYTILIAGGGLVSLFDRFKKQ